MDRPLNSSLHQIVAAVGLGAPDGRPLHRYPLSLKQMAELRTTIRDRFAAGSGATSAAIFVLWAAEYFRSRFPDGGYRRWDFVWAGLGVRGNDNLGRSLVESGFVWWKRPIRKSEAGQQLYVYSLLAEGGIPQSLLAQEGLYKRVLLGLVSDLENEDINDPFRAERVAARWISVLPRVFQTDEFAKLIAGFAVALRQLRAALPEDLSGLAAQTWLDRYRPGWAGDLPLRMSPQIAEQLIRPLLSNVRGRSTSAGPLATRELMKDNRGCWNWFLRLQDQGFMSYDLLPGSSDLRLKLVPLGASADSPDAPVYAAAPEQLGFQLRRIGRAGPAVLPFRPEVPFVLGAFADGRAKGEVIVAPGLPSASEAPSLWRSADPTEPDTTHLVPQPGAGRTKGSSLWLLAPEMASVSAEVGVKIAGPYPASNARIWRLSGQGIVKVGPEAKFRIETGANSELPEARLVATGQTLRTWRTEHEGDLVYLGAPRIFGELGTSGPQLLAGRALRYVAHAGRRLGLQGIEWIDGTEVLARLRMICLPGSLRLKVAETAPGQVRLTVEGLPPDIRLTLRAGSSEARTTLSNGTGELTLTTSDTPVGELHLRLADVSSGTALELAAPWPARGGLILNPGGLRLDKDQPIGAAALRGWRGVAPDGAQADLTLRLRDHQQVALPVAGEIPLYQYVPLIRSLLAQGGPDAQINLNLVVDGQEGRRLEIRRYHDHAMVEGDRLWAGLTRGVRSVPQSALAEQLDRQPITLHAVNLSSPSESRTLTDTSVRNLRVILGETGGPWLIQPTLDERAQRAVIWATSPVPQLNRDSRIAMYEQQAWRLLSAPDLTQWDELLRLIISVGHGGDAGVADQVQALARVPSVVVALVLRASRDDLPDLLSLDTAAPLFWPTLPIAAFRQAIQLEYERKQRRLLEAGFEPAEAKEEAERALARRAQETLAIHPELAGHFCAGLVQSDLASVVSSMVQSGCISLFPNPIGQLKELAQMAGRRFDRLPTGIGRVEPLQRPIWSAGFNHYLQAVIDAPLSAAEFATGQRQTPTAKEIISLINLRLVDPLYFDAALPTAIAFTLNEQCR